MKCQMLFSSIQMYSLLKLQKHVILHPGQQSVRALASRAARGDCADAGPASLRPRSLRTATQPRPLPPPCCVLELILSLHTPGINLHCEYEHNYTDVAG